MNVDEILHSQPVRWLVVLSLLVLIILAADRLALRRSGSRGYLSRRQRMWCWRIIFFELCVSAVDGVVDLQKAAARLDFGWFLAECGWVAAPFMFWHSCRHLVWPPSTTTTTAAADHDG